MRRRPKDVALKKPLIQVNEDRCITYLVFDIDRNYGGIAWDDANLPEPNFTIINPDNGHAHLIYSLRDPVTLRRPSDLQYGTDHPVRYLRAVWKAMRRALHADRRYTGQMAKNPFHPGWRTLYGPTQGYSLGQLSEHLDLDDSDHEKPDAELQENPDGRNSTLFDSLRFYAYRNKAGYQDQHEFITDLQDQADHLNGLIDSPRGSLGFREIAGIVKSVGKWVWNRYTGSGKIYNRGIMQLDQSLSLQIRQKLAQRRTITEMVSGTLRKITLAILQLVESGIKKVTRKAVALRCGLHRNTVYRYWKQANEKVGFTSDNVKGDSLLSVPVTQEGETGCQGHKSSVRTLPGVVGGFPDSQQMQHIPKDKSFILQMAKKLWRGMKKSKPLPVVETATRPRTSKIDVQAVVDSYYERKRTTARFNGHLPAT